MKRRLFLFAAPAIVAAPSLMRVSTAAIVPASGKLYWEVCPSFSVGFDGYNNYSFVTANFGESAFQTMPPAGFQPMVGYWFEPAPDVQPFVQGDVIKWRPTGEGDTVEVWVERAQQGSSNG